jgi:hypothetical protein
VNIDDPVHVTDLFGHLYGETETLRHAAGPAFPRWPPMRSMERRVYLHAAQHGRIPLQQSARKREDILSIAGMAQPAVPITGDTVISYLDQDG